MRKLLALLLCAAILVPGSPLAAAQYEAPAPRAAMPAPLLPVSALRVNSLGASLPTAARFPASLEISATGGNLSPAAPAASATPVLAPEISAPERKSPLAAHAAAAPRTPAAAAVSARAQLSAAQRALAPPPGAVPSAGESRLRSERVWSGAGEKPASDVDALAVDAAADASRPAPAASRLSKPSRAAALFAAAAAVPAPKAAAGLAPAMAHWMAPLWTAAQPYVAGGAVLAATYAAHRGVRWVVDRLAKRGRWDPNAADTARFVGAIATWSAGAAVGLHLAGASTTALLTGFGVALSLAVKKTVSNLLYGTYFLLNRPFVIGEKLRVGDTMYQVEDMQLQYVTMKVLGKLAADKPDPAPAGVKVVPFKELDPLGRDADDKGNKWVLIRQVSPGPAPREGVEQIARLKYANLAGSSITLYRPYTRGKELPSLHLGALGLAKVSRPRFPVGPVLATLRETRGSAVRAAVWMAVSLAFIPLLPLAKAWLAWKALALLYPYVHGAVSFWATRQVAKFIDRFIPILGGKLGWSRQAIIVTKLLAEAGVYFIGSSATLRALGLEWRSVATSLGATAAAISFASSDMLGNLATALMLRFDRPFNIGDTLRVGTDVGIVQEMNMFYVVLKVADGSHTLVPYSVIDATELDTYQSPEARQNPK